METVIIPWPFESKHKVLVCSVIVHLIITGVDGLCASAGRRAIRFGEDVTSACKLQLDITNFTDCTGLRLADLSTIQLTIFQV